MFKSSEKLRHEAAQRSLDRVASSWRQSRTTWFDGTPESIAARLAETGRVLTVARSGYSPAHLELTVEAERARRELLAAQHRLLTDFLDDGARNFKGSRRVAGDGDPMLDHQNAMDSARGDQDYRDFIHQHLRDTGPGQASTCSQCSGPTHDDSTFGGEPICNECLDEVYADAGQPPPSMDHGDYQGRHRSGAARRVAKERGLRECINCGGALSGEQDDDKESECGTCGMSAHQKGVDWRKKDAAQHSFDDVIERAYKNKGIIDHPMVGVNPGDGVYRNQPGMVDGYDGPPYGPGASTRVPYDVEDAYTKPYIAEEDPDFTPAEYLGPAGRDLGGKHRMEEGY
jgi:hypothetical protein